MNGRFAVAVAATSGLVVAAVASLTAAARADSPILFGAGAILALVAALGVLALVRAVVVNERAQGRP